MMSNANEEEVLDLLDTRIERMASIQDFNEFLEALEGAWRKGIFEQQDVTEYLNGIWGVIDAHAEAEAEGRTEKPVEPSWPFFADTLLRAFFHS